MITREDNPYVPGFGIVPPALAGREAEFGDLESALRRVRRGIYEQPRLLSGDRGMGKTAILVDLVAASQEQGIWAVQVEATPSGNALVPLLRDLNRILTAHDRDARLGAYARQALGVLTAFALRHGGNEISVDVEPSRLGGGSGDLATDLADVLEAVGQVASRGETSLLMTVDEIHVMPAAQMGPLFVALQRIARSETEPGLRLPVLVVVAGLPQSLAAMRAASSTYAERVREHELGALEEGAVVEALVVPAEQLEVRYEPGALHVLIEAMGGYPYFVQLMAYEAWNAAADAGAASAIDERAASSGVAAGRQAATRLYSSRLSEVPETERRYLEVVAALSPQERQASRIAKELGGTASDWGWARQRLIDRGLLRPDGYGRVAFALPGLDQFLRN